MPRSTVNSVLLQTISNRYHHPYRHISNRLKLERRAGDWNIFWNLPLLALGATMATLPLLPASSLHIINNRMFTLLRLFRYIFEDGDSHIRTSPHLRIMLRDTASSCWLKSNWSFPGPFTTNSFPLLSFLATEADDCKNWWKGGISEETALLTATDFNTLTIRSR